MTPARRREVASVITKTNITLFEDDTYGRLDRDSATIASLIPERTYLVASLSKCIAPGLRVSFVVAPDQRRHVRGRFTRNNADVNSTDDGDGDTLAARRQR